MSAAPAVDIPQVVLEAEPKYLLGFPILVAVTFDNSFTQTQFLNLPEIWPWTTRGRFALTFEPVGQGRRFHLDPAPPEMEPGGLVLNPGQSTRQVLDLSNFTMGITPGKYRLTFTLYVGKHARDSKPVEINLLKAGEDESVEAARLRGLARPPTDTGAWAPFLTKNWNTVKPGSTLSPKALEQLRYHLFLHRAFYGPTDVAHLVPSATTKLTGPVLEPERALIEFEIAAATHPTAAMAAGNALAKKWPTLVLRINQTLAGEGLLATGRKAFGAEAAQFKSPATKPYAP
jgi:hypothetical protein